MSELVSMKMSAKDRKEQYPSSLATGDDAGPLYPYGLSVTLDNDALEKLALDPLPAVGTALLLVARVEVTSVESRKGPDREKRQSVSLQITDCCLEPESKRGKIEDALYPKKD